MNAILDLLRLESSNMQVSNSVSVSYTHLQKKKRIRTIEAVPLYLKHQLDTKEKLEQYFVESYGYENPNVRIEKIKMYSLIKVNGFYLYLTGRASKGKQLRVCNAVQMVLSQKWMLYVKEITKAYNAQY